MQRYSGGLKVPREMMEDLPAQTTSGTGVLDYWLKYPPKTLNHIQLDYAYEATRLNRIARVEAIVSGRHVYIRVYKFISPGGGAACTTSLCLTELQGALVINYEVA